MRPLNSNSVTLGGVQLKQIIHLKKKKNMMK